MENYQSKWRLIGFFFKKSGDITMWSTQLLNKERVVILPILPTGSPEKKVNKESIMHPNKKRYIDRDINIGMLLKQNRTPS